MFVYISSQCPNCTRLLHGLHRVPSLRGKYRVIDIDTLAPDQRASLEFVPTVVVQGQHFVGSKAFEYLKQYDGEVELEPMGLGTGALAYADVGGDGSMQYIEQFGDFSVPPQ